MHKRDLLCVNNIVLSCFVIYYSHFTRHFKNQRMEYILLDFSLTVKAATLIFISGCGLTISSAKEGKSGFIHNLVKSK